MILAFGAAHAAEVPRDGELVLGPDEASRLLVLDLDDHLPGQIALGGKTARDLTIHRAGLLTLDANGMPGGPPLPLSDLAMTTVIAPFWAPLQVGPCPDGDPAGEVRRLDTPTGVHFAWIDVPLAGCPSGGESATFSVELVLDDRGAVTALIFRYETLPSETLVVEPRAGFRAESGGRTAVFELFPDGAQGPQRGRSKLLVEGSSDGTEGLWVIEVGGDGEVLGEREPDFLDADGEPRRPDGWRAADNCPRHFNPLQGDLDRDGHGDACDEDIDDDRIMNWDDNCPRHHNAEQKDTDGDGRGDRCDSNDDNDLWPDVFDRCPQVATVSNTDLDGDGWGDACDVDADGDDDAAELRWPGHDQCPFVFDPRRRDSDGDGLGDACDLKPLQPCHVLVCVRELDSDGDRIADVVDICPFTPDPEQNDMDRDGLGDVCDGDRNGDGYPEIGDMLVREPVHPGDIDPRDPNQRVGW